MKIEIAVEIEVTEGHAHPIAGTIETPLCGHVAEAPRGLHFVEEEAHGPAEIIRHVKVEVAVIVGISQLGPVAPARVIHAEFLRGLAERAIALVDEEQVR